MGVPDCTDCGDAPPDLPELYTVDEVAALLRTSPAAVRGRVKRGQIPGVVAGLNPRRFRVSEIRAWLGLDKSTATNG